MSASGEGFMALPVLNYAACATRRRRFACAAGICGFIALVLFGLMLFLPLSVPGSHWQSIRFLIVAVIGVAVTSLGIYFAIRSFVAGEQKRWAIAGLVPSILLWPFYLWMACLKVTAVLHFI
jgi:hypothetical protein